IATIALPSSMCRPLEVRGRCSPVPGGPTSRREVLGAAVSLQPMSLRSEIAEQPRVVARLLEVGWPEARTLARPLAAADPLTIAPRGSSDNAATYGKYLFESLAGLVTALA